VLLDGFHRRQLIHLNGLHLGRRQRTVTFAVDANSGASQRNGYITVQRQSTPVAQAGAAISIPERQPDLGAGATVSSRSSSATNMVTGTCPA